MDPAKFVNEVVLVKILTGEVFVARVSKELDKDAFLIKKPIVFHAARGEQGLGFQPMPWLLTHDMEEPLVISGSHIVCFAKVDREIKNVYNKIVGEGIQLANETEMRAIDHMSQKLGNKRAK